MKLTLDKLRHIDPQYKSTLQLNLDNQGLRDFDILGQECEQLQLLSLRYNQITNLRPIQSLNNLWVIDLQQNQIANFSGLSQFKVLGSLSLTINNTNANQLSQLRNVFIIQLNLVGPIERNFIINQMPKIWVLNEKYITLTERQQALKNDQGITISEQQNNSDETQENIILPISMYMNERAQEFLEHFGTLQQQKRYYFCKENVQFDSSDFYDFQEKKFYYLISHTDYCHELELINSGSNIGNTSNTNKSVIKQSITGLPHRFHQLYINRWMCMSYSNKLLLVVFLHSYLEGLISQEVLVQMMELILKDIQVSQNSQQNLQQECQTLIYKIPAHLQMGLTVFLRQDLINNLQDDQEVYSSQQSQSQLPPINLGSQQQIFQSQQATSPVSFGGAVNNNGGYNSSQLFNPNNNNNNIKSVPQTGYNSLHRVGIMNNNSGSELTSGQSRTNLIGSQGAQSTQSKSIDKMNQEKMLQILECLNINNLIYKFSEVQRNLEVYYKQENAQNLQQKKSINKNVPNPSKLIQPKLIDFPMKELEADGDQEVLEILKERRRAICEFLLKIMNSFKMIDQYFIDGTLINIKNILNVIEEQAEKNKIKVNFFEKYGNLPKQDFMSRQKQMSQQNTKNNNHQLTSLDNLPLQTQSFGPFQQQSFQSSLMNQQVQEALQVLNQKNANKDLNDHSLDMLFNKQSVNSQKPSTEEQKRNNKILASVDAIDLDEIRKTADFTNKNQMNLGEHVGTVMTLTSQEDLTSNKQQLPIKMPKVDAYAGQSPPLTKTDRVSASSSKQGTSRDSARRHKSGSQMQAISNQSQLKFQLIQKGQQNYPPIDLSQVDDAARQSNKKVVFNQYQQRRSTSKNLISIQNQNNGTVDNKSKSAQSFKSNDQNNMSGSNNMGLNNNAASAHKNQSIMMQPKFQYGGGFGGNSELQTSSNQIGMPPSALSYYQGPNQQNTNLESIQSSSYFSSNPQTLNPTHRENITKNIFNNKAKYHQSINNHEFLKIDSQRESQGESSNQTKRQNLNSQPSYGMLPSLKKSQSMAQVGYGHNNQQMGLTEGNTPFKAIKVQSDSIVPFGDHKNSISAIKSQKSIADLHQIQPRQTGFDSDYSQSQQKTLLSRSKGYTGSFKFLPSQGSISEQPSKAEKSIFYQNKSLQVSQAQSMMSGASSQNYILVDSKKKKGQIRTRDLWAGIHRTQDVVKCMTQNEHIKRVFTRENTPYMMHGIVPSFEKRKDPFVQKYQILLNHVQREKEIIKQAEKEREKMVQETQEAKDLINQTQNSSNYNQKLKHHFDSYIKALALNKQLFSLENVDEEETNEKQILDQYYKDKNKSDSKTALALENDISSSNINNQQDAGNSYFITQKDKFM
eukprot:403366984